MLYTTLAIDSTVVAYEPNPILVVHIYIYSRTLMYSFISFTKYLVISSSGLGGSLRPR